MPVLVERETNPALYALCGWKNNKPKSVALLGKKWQLKNTKCHQVIHEERKLVMNPVIVVKGDDAEDAWEIHGISNDWTRTDPATTKKDCAYSKALNAWSNVFTTLIIQELVFERLFKQRAWSMPLSRTWRSREKQTIIIRVLKWNTRKAARPASSNRYDFNRTRREPGWFHNQHCDGACHRTIRSSAPRRRKWDLKIGHTRMENSSRKDHLIWYKNNYGRRRLS